MFFIALCYLHVFELKFGSGGLKTSNRFLGHMVPYRLQSALITKLYFFLQKYLQLEYRMKRKHQSKLDAFFTKKPLLENESSNFQQTKQPVTSINSACSGPSTSQNINTPQVSPPETIADPPINVSRCDTIETDENEHHNHGLADSDISVNSSIFVENLPHLPSDTDIGHFLQKRKNCSDEEKIMCLTKRWVPANQQEFPVSRHTRGGKEKQRSLNANLLRKFEWLAISRYPEFEGGWCVYCALFYTTGEAGGKKGMGQKLGKFVLTPLNDFSNLTGKTGALDCHDKCLYHQVNKVRALDFLTHTKSDESVLALVNKKHQQDVINNRATLASIIETVMFAGLQNISLRGHRDHGKILPSGIYPDENDGNFRQLLRFRIQAGDDKLKNHFRESGIRTQYTSPQIQNEILSVVSEKIKQRVGEEIKSAFAWCIMADETTDRANREQLVIVARYVERNGEAFCVKENPICIVDLFEEMKESVSSDAELRMTGDNISKVILSRIKKIELPMQRLVAQSYDGAAFMSSQRIGVAAKLLEISPLAYYFHCAMHGLNLATSQINRVDIIRNSLGTMESVLVFLNDGAKREKNF